MQFVKILIIHFLFIFTFGCSNLSLVYLQDAKMINTSKSENLSIAKNRPEPVKRLLNGHYIESGDSLVFLIRKFDQGKIFSIDDEYFEKLTIEVKNYSIGQPIKIGSSDVSFFYSEGNSGYIYKGHGLYSITGSGQIIINKVGRNTIIAKIDMVISTEPAGIYPPRGRKIEIKDRLIFKEKKIEELTPWLAAPHSSFGKEVYP